MEGIFSYQRPSNQYQNPIHEIEKSNGLTSPMDALRRGNKFKAFKMIDDIETNWSSLNKHLSEFQREANLNVDTSSLTNEYMKIIQTIKESAKKMH